MRTIIDKIRNSLLTCSVCGGHPYCLSNGKTECEKEGCLFSAFCSEAVCRFVHEHGFTRLKSYSLMENEVTIDNPCCKVMPLFFYDDFSFFEIDKSVVPVTASELVTLILDIPEQHPEDPCIGVFADNIIRIRKTVLAYMDYILLRRRLDGQDAPDVQMICTKLGVEYNRKALKEFIDPREYALLVDEKEEIAESNSLISLSSISEQSVFQDISVGLPVINTEEIWRIMNVNKSYRNMFIFKLCELRRDYSLGSKGKYRIKPNKKDFIILGETLFDMCAINKTDGKLDFVRNFLTALGLQYSEIKLYGENEKESERWIPFLPNLAPIDSEE